MLLLVSHFRSTLESNNDVILFPIIETGAKYGNVSDKDVMPSRMTVKWKREEKATVAKSTLVSKILQGSTLTVGKKEQRWADCKFFQSQSSINEIESDSVLIRQIFENYQSNPVLIRQCKIMHFYFASW